jgi:tetratricopeptide (TPR) repeat protein
MKPDSSPPKRALTRLNTAGQLLSVSPVLRNSCCQHGVRSRLTAAIRILTNSPTVVALTIILFSALSNNAQTNTPDKRIESAAGLIRDGRLQEAEQQLALILKTKPNEALALNLLGTIRAQQEKLNDAEVLFLRAIRIDGQLIGAHMNLAHLYALRHEPAKSISELKAVLRLDPNNSEVLQRLPGLLFAQGRIDEGIEALEQARQSGSIATPQLVLLGDAYLKKGNTNKAEESFQLALNQQSDDVDAVLGLAQVSQLRGDDKTASSYLSQARKLVVKSPNSLYRFALVAQALGLYEEANTSLRAAIKLKSDEPAYFLALGNTWIKKPDLQEAEQAFRRALQLQPDSAQAQMYLGYALLEQKKYPEAGEWLEKSLQRDSSIPETYYYLGLIAQEHNEDARAIELFKNAIRLVPSYSFPHVALGSSYLKLKNYELAKQELELSVKLNPNDAKAHYNLALLYARLKDPKRAQEEMGLVEKLKRTRKLLEKEGRAAPPSSPNPQ